MNWIATDGVQALLASMARRTSGPIARARGADALDIFFQGRRRVVAAPTCPAAG